MEATKKLAEFVVDTGYQELPQELIEKTKEAFLDWVGVTLAGLTEESGDLIINYVKEQGGHPQATILGTDLKTSTTNAALVMGTLSHALDFDDVYWPMLGHPSVTLFPVVFALGEHCQISGKKAIEAFVVGFEVEGLLGVATAEEHYHKGWHATSTIGPLGAAAVAAKIMGLDYKKTRNALGLAASHAGGLRENFGTMTKPFHAGNAARGGLAAALLAGSGFTASENILEAGLGFANVLCGKDKHKINEMTARIGQGWGLLHPGRATKKYPSCGATHSAIDCMLAICQENDLKAQDIENIDCLVDPHVLNILIHSRPQKGLEGKFSMQYCLAVASLDGIVGLKQFTDERAQRPDVQEMVKKVNLVPSPTAGIRETTVKVMAKGRISEKTVSFAKGSPENPLTYKEMVEKFEMCAEDILITEQIQKVIEDVNNLENLTGINSLIEKCRPEKL